MQRVTKVADTLWRHKKKSAAAGVCLYFLGDWLRRWDVNSRIRKQYALQAEKFGHQPISAEERPRRVTVLVNVSANERSAFDDFKTNALPLLHLAGLEVNVIKTESEAQLQSLAEALDHEEADAIYVVGGDGSLARVLTGVCRRGGATGVQKPQLPIGVFPGGYDNRALRNLVPSVFGVQTDVRWMCESAMALIEELKRPVTLFRVSFEDANGEKVEEERWGLGDVGAGWFRHIEDKRRRLWYWAGLKRRFAYFWEMLKNMEVKVQWKEWCDGCNRCRSQHMTQTPVPQWRWWYAIVGTPRYKLQNAVPQKDYSKIENEACGREGEAVLRGSDLLIENEQKELVLRVGGEGVGRVGVVSEGWARCKRGVIGSEGHEGFHSTPLPPAASISLRFTHLPDFIRRVYVNGDSVELPEETGQRTVRVETSSNTVTLFLPTSLRVVS